jgi:hypothetical protein
MRVWPPQRVARVSLSKRARRVVVLLLLFLLLFSGLFGFVLVRI